MTGRLSGFVLLIVTAVMFLAVGPTQPEAISTKLEDRPPLDQDTCPEPTPTPVTTQVPLCAVWVSSFATHEQGWDGLVRGGWSVRDCTLACRVR